MNKVFNILHVVTRLPVGGVENMLLKVVKSYDKIRFNVSVCCLKEGGEVARQLQEAGYEVTILGSMKKHGFDLRGLLSLLRLIREKEIHILRTHSYHANLYGRTAGILAKVPVVIPSFHDQYRSPDTPKIHRRLLNYSLSYFSDALVAVSNSVASDIARYDMVKPAKIKIIYNGIEIEKFNREISKHEARKILNFPDDFTIIGSVGRLTAQKGHRHLIEAASKLRNVCVAIAGDGCLMEELRIFAEESHVQCIFTGRLSPDQIPLFLKAADIFCFPSLWEGFGTAIVEAMAAGLPVILSDIPPHKEVAGAAGMFIPAGNAEALAVALKALLDDPSLRNKLGDKAQERAKLFSVEITVKSYEALFEKVLSQKGIA